MKIVNWKFQNWSQKYEKIEDNFPSKVKIDLKNVKKRDKKRCKWAIN